MMSFLAVEREQTLRASKQTLDAPNMVHDHERRHSTMRASSTSGLHHAFLVGTTLYLAPATDLVLVSNSLSTFFTSRSPSFPR